MTRTIFIGIDPGVSGALAVIGNDVQVHDAPTIETRGTRREFMLPEMRKLLRDATGNGLDQAYAIVEDVNPMPREGVVSAGAFMRGVGLWEGLLAGLGIPFSKVRPQVWKKEFAIALPPAKPGKKKDPKIEEAERRKRQVDQKARAIIIAQRLFPTMSLARKKDHGRAEALLIAEYARRTWNPGQTHFEPDTGASTLIPTPTGGFAWVTPKLNPKALRPK